MRKISAYLLLLLFAFYSVGCDSSSNDPSVMELLADDWMFSSVSDSQGDQTDVVLLVFNSLDITFTSGGSFSILVDSKAENGDVTIAGTWAVNESQNKLTLATEYGGITLDLDFTYAFTNDDMVRLTASPITSILLNQLLGTALQGSVTITIERA